MFEVTANSILIPTPAVGAVVTFCFESYSRRDIPLNPIITRVRSDILWDELIRGTNLEQKLEKGM